MSQKPKATLCCSVDLELAALRGRINSTSSAIKDDSDGNPNDWGSVVLSQKSEDQTTELRWTSRRVQSAAVGRFTPNL